MMIIMIIIIIIIIILLETQSHGLNTHNNNTINPLSHPGEGGDRGGYLI